MKTSVKLALLFALVTFAAALYEDCPGKINEKALITAQPEQLASVKNGKKFIIRDPANPLLMHIKVAVLKGSAYEMGYAMGEMFKSEVHTVVNGVKEFINIGEEYWVHTIPKWMENWEHLSVKEKLWLGLDYEITATAHYTPQRFFDELKGISDASGVDYDLLLKINLFPELCRAVCSIVGAYGKATPDGNLLQLRALDYFAQSPFNNEATMVIYHPSEKGSQHFANIGWPGMIGTLAAYNGNVGIGERLWDYDLDSISSIFGEPWMFVIRDVVQFSTNITEAIDYLQDANRTYSIRLGAGSKVDNQFRGFEYTYSYLKTFTDKNSSSPHFDDIVYWYKDGDTKCFAEVFEANYGNITAETIYRLLSPLGKTGDTIMAVYDYARDDIYLSMASNWEVAYYNHVFYFDMDYWFDVLPSDNADDDDMGIELTDDDVEFFTER